MARCVLARAQPSKFYDGTREDDVRQQSFYKFKDS